MIHKKSGRWVCRCRLNSGSYWVWNRSFDQVRCLQLQVWNCIKPKLQPHWSFVFPLCDLPMHFFITSRTREPCCFQFCPDLPFSVAGLTYDWLGTSKRLEKKLRSVVEILSSVFWISCNFMGSKPRMVSSIAPAESCVFLNWHIWTSRRMEDFNWLSRSLAALLFLSTVARITRWGARSDDFVAVINPFPLEGLVWERS